MCPMDFSIKKSQTLERSSISQTKILQQVFMDLVLDVYFGLKSDLQGLYSSI